MNHDLKNDLIKLIEKRCGSTLDKENLDYPAFGSQLKLSKWLLVQIISDVFEIYHLIYDPHLILNDPIFSLNSFLDSLVLQINSMSFK